MFVQLNIDTSTPADLAALAALVAALSGPQPAKYDERFIPMKTMNVTDNGTFDVPPVPIEQAIIEAHADEEVHHSMPEPTPAPAEPTTAKPLSVADALAAIQDAQKRGIGIDKVRAILAEKFDGKRVTELDEEKRAAFVAALVAA